MTLTQFDPDIRIPAPGEVVKRGVTVFLQGDLGTYKTTWAAQWPSPLFFSFMHEGGDQALEHVPELYGTAPIPRIHISSTKQFAQKLAQFMGYYQQAGIKTLVIDPINGYQDMWMAELISLRKHKLSNQSDAVRNRAQMTPTAVASMDQQDWKFLFNNVAYEIMKPLHSLPDLNVIWICHEEDDYEGEGDAKRRVGVKPIIQGRIRRVLPTQCSLYIHAKKGRVFDKGAKLPREVVRFNVAQDAEVQAGLRHRFANMLNHSPFLVDPRVQDLPTYYALELYIGKYIAGGIDHQAQPTQQ